MGDRTEENGLKGTESKKKKERKDNLEDGWNNLKDWGEKWTNRNVEGKNVEKIGISKYKEIIRKNEKRKMKNIQSGGKKGRAEDERESKRWQRKNRKLMDV